MKVRPPTPRFKSLLSGAILACCACAAGCDRLDMYDQPRYEPLEASTYFENGMSSRPPVAGTVARGQLHEDEAYQTGKLADRLVSAIPEAAYRATYDRQSRRFGKSFSDAKPPAIRLALLERGEQRFNIHCAVCHSRDGDGDGIVVQRGFPKPPSYQDERLREAAVGHFFDVITNGHGAMASYKSRVDVADRWAIAAYIRALQLSQHARLDDVPAAGRRTLSGPDQRGVPAP